MRTNKMFLTIQESNCDLSKVDDILEKKERCYKRYAYIEHTEESRKHIHLWLELTRTREIEEIAKWFNNSHVDPGKYQEKCIQYLTHKNNPDKEQYDFSLIKSNDIDYIKELYERTEEEIKHIAEENKPLNTDEKELYNDIINNHMSFQQIIYSQKYSLIFLQKRLKIIEYLCNEQYKKDIKDNYNI